MAIDMKQFHQVFFEESFEGLDAMESGLLNLDLGDVNADDINTIFRAAHSIKGGSGTFGFSAVSDFTHVMETLLDEMRDGRRQATQAAINVLLGSVDCLRDMMQAIRSDSDINRNSVNQHKQALEDELQTGGGSQAGVAAASGAASLTAQLSDNDASIVGWVIAFSPHKDMLKTGNDPVRLFRELATLGDLSVAVDLQGVPDLADLDPEDCHLSWRLSIASPVAVQAIEEIFDWVEDDCDLALQAIYGSQRSALAVADAAPQAEPTAAAQLPLRPAKPCRKPTPATATKKPTANPPPKPPAPFASTPAKSTP